MDGISYKLPVHVGVVAQEGCFCAFLDASKKDFRCVSSQIQTTEDRVVQLEHGRSRLTIELEELIQDEHHAHPCMPSLDGWIIQYLEGIIDSRIKNGEARPLDVSHGEEVVFTMCKCHVDGGLLRSCERS